MLGKQPFTDLHLALMRHVIRHLPLGPARRRFTARYDRLSMQRARRALYRARLWR